jgi:phage/plasmid-associated DNA primase
MSLLLQPSSQTYLHAMLSFPQWFAPTTTVQNVLFWLTFMISSPVIDESLFFLFSGAGESGKSTIVKQMK